jgi:transposase
MRRSEGLQGVRVMRFLDILGRYEAAEFNQTEAAELLGIDERTFRRWRQRFEDDGEAGLLDRRLGKASGKRVPVDRADEVEALYRERYRGFTARHFHEHLVAEHKFSWSYTWTKTFLQSKGLLEKAKRRGAHRRKRPRRPMPGMMLHQDGSRHEWLQGRPALDLIVTLDDATGAIYSAFLVEEEGTASTFRALKETFGAHGLPMSLYTDRGAHYFHTPEAGGKIDRKRPTQVGRALEQLGVEHIGAYSPQARGRSERAFQTLQDRLVKELALAGIDTIEAADAFLRDVYLPAYNARFAVPQAEPGSAFVPIPGVDLAEILCVHEERQVGNDNCVSFNRLKLQIPESPLRPHFVKARVKVHLYPDGSHALFHGPRCIGRYDQKGQIKPFLRAAQIRSAA